MTIGHSQAAGISFYFGRPGLLAGLDLIGHDFAAAPDNRQVASDDQLASGIFRRAPDDARLKRLLDLPIGFVDFFADFGRRLRL